MVIRAVTETIEALMLRHNIRVKEQNLGGRLAHHTTASPAHHRPGLRGAVRLRGVIRTSGPVRAVHPSF